MLVLAMHIPDGFLSLPVSVVAWLLYVALLAVALRRTRGAPPHHLPMMGIMAAFVFAAQMINFPVWGGTSGHLIGGALVAVLLGPWPTALVMTAVVAVQALVFADGGLLALGANGLNMSLISPLIGYAAYQAVLGVLPERPLPAAAVGAWIGVQAAALACALQLVLSGTSKALVVIPAMLGMHALVGLGEAAITATALAFIRKTRPDLLTPAVPVTGYRWAAAGLLIALLVTAFAPLADPNPDGLERVAIDSGFAAQAQEAAPAPLSDYSVPITDNEALSTVLAGVIGVLLVAGVSLGMGRLGRGSR